jgi:hypothetical protein
MILLLFARVRRLLARSLSAKVQHGARITARVGDHDAVTAHVTHHARYTATVTDRPL